VYGLSGDSLNGFTDAIRRSEGIRWEHVRHEEATAFAASADDALTGQLAVCAGSCGPGNLHLMKGLFDAHRPNTSARNSTAPSRRSKCRTSTLLLAGTTRPAAHSAIDLLATKKCRLPTPATTPVTDGWDSAPRGRTMTSSTRPTSSPERATTGARNTTIDESPAARIRLAPKRNLTCSRFLVRKSLFALAVARARLPTVASRRGMSWAATHYGYPPSVPGPAARAGPDALRPDPSLDTGIREASPLPLRKQVALPVITYFLPPTRHRTGSVSRSGFTGLHCARARAPFRDDPGS